MGRLSAHRRSAAATQRTRRDRPWERLAAVKLRQGPSGLGVAKAGGPFWGGTGGWRRAGRFWVWLLRVAFWWWFVWMVVSDSVRLVRGWQQHWPSERLASFLASFYSSFFFSLSLFISKTLLHLEPFPGSSQSCSSISFAINTLQRCDQHHLFSIKAREASPKLLEKLLKKLSSSSGKLFPAKAPTPTPEPSTTVSGFSLSTPYRFGFRLAGGLSLLHEEQRASPATAFRVQITAYPLLWHGRCAPPGPSLLRLQRAVC